MNKNILGIVLLISIGIVNTALHASDTTTQCDFNYFDKNVFTNHVTNKFELIYSTQLVKSEQRNFIVINKYHLEQLIYPALTRIVYKQSTLALRHCNNCSWLAQILEHKEDETRYWEKENRCSIQLDTVYKTVKKLESRTTSICAHIVVPTDELMLVVQYAAQKIRYLHPGIVGIIVSSGDESQEVFADGQFAKLIEKYRIYENQQADN